MTKTAKVYGDSLYELAVSDSQDYAAVLLNQMKTVQDLFTENPDYIRLLSEPSISRKERLDMIDQAFGSSAEIYLVNFLKILCESELLGEYAGCYQEYKKRYQKDNNISEAYVTSAVKLSDEQKTALKNRLENIYHKKVIMIEKVDPSLVGGLKIEIDDEQIDGTIKNRLDRLHRQIIRQ